MPEEQNYRNGKKRGGKVLIAAALIVIIALLATIVVLLLRKKEEPAAPEPAVPERETLVTEENAEAIAEEMINRDSTIPQSYNVTMNTEWEFEDGSEPSVNAYVENSTRNSNAVYFDVIISDTGEKIVESPIIPVGESMNKISLNRDLEAGTYDCVCTYHLVDDAGQTLTTLNMGVTITVNK